MPEPIRHLFEPGRAAWDRVWAAHVFEVTSPTMVELVQVACEQLDERALLRPVVFRDGHWRDRAALRTLDLQVVQTLTAIQDRMSSGTGSRSPFDDLLASLGDPA